MERPSSQKLNLIPTPYKLQRVCKALATLEAILSPEWEDRYYSYQKDWSETEELCEMRNGQGDQVLILFSPNGTVINGFARDSAMNGWASVQSEQKRSFIQFLLGHKKERQTTVVQDIWPGVTNDLPEEFHEFVFGEPVRSIGSTFCIWSKQGSEQWTIGPINFPDDEYVDGSSELLELFDGNPSTYKTWASEYYGLENLDLELVETVYAHAPITDETIRRLNPELEDLIKLKSDLDEIGFSYEL